VSARLSTTTRGRRLSAALLGVLAVLATVLVGPGATSVHREVTASAVTVRAVAPVAAGLRHHIGPVASVDRPALGGHGPSPSATLTSAAVLAALVAIGLAVLGRTGRLPRRTPGRARGRAPPAPAVA
jgi:hypothetical protein